MTRDFREIIREAIRRNALIPPGAPVVVGFSGGADSTALLLVLQELQAELDVTLVAAHFDHALRPESARDATWARERAAEWRVPFVESRAAWGPDGSPPHANVEAKARQARYEFLHRIAQERDAIVAVGHHAEDRVETILAQWIRGAGPRGLSMPRARREDGLARPLLDVTRAEILAYLESRGVPFLRDPSNEDGSNLRARLRRDVLPALLRENPELPRVVGRSAALFADLDDFVQREATQAARALLVSERPGEIVLDGPAGRPYHRIVLLTILRNAIRGQGPSAEAAYDPLDRLVRAWQGGGHEAIDLRGGLRVSVDPQRVVIALRHGIRPVLIERDLQVPGETSLDPPGVVLRLDEFTHAPKESGDGFRSGVAWLDAETVKPPLRVRARRPGDRYRPAGLGGSAKIQDLLVDRKVPRHVRDTVPLIVDAEGILWIPGFRVDERAQISDRTRTVWRLQVSGNAPWIAEATK